MAYVYCHFKEDDGQPFYVGIGRKKSRANEMRGRSFWHKNVAAAHGIKIFVIAEVCDWESAQWWEKAWIKALKNDGYNLVNLTPGGDGGPTWIGKKHSEETKKKISAATKGNKGNKGRVFSKEHRKKLSLAQMGNKKALGSKHSEEACLKKSFARKGIKLNWTYKWTEEHREKNILARKGQKRTDEQRQRMREGWIKRRAKMENPEL